MAKKYDFSGWATRNNLKCSDGRTILKHAFIDDDGKTVPMVWNHQHNDPLNVLGHAELENREDGVYAYGVFNDTDAGKSAKLLVEHGDIVSLSIYANQLQQQGPNVVHGAIREVSLVLAGANPGAFIDSVISHGEENSEEATIYTGEAVEILHADMATDVSKKDTTSTDTTKTSTNTKPKEEVKTVKDVVDSMTDEQKKVLYALVGEAQNSDQQTTKNTETTETVSHNNEGGTTMKHNIFEAKEEDTTSTKNEMTLSHSEMEAILGDAKRYGSLRDSVLQHGIEQIDYLFPDARTMETTPQFIQRKNGWVAKVMTGTHHTPFSRLKSIFADITADDARAKGYLKGNLKKDEVFALLKRTTTPTTIYKKQKLDRDDVVDIVDFDVVAWLKSEMRLMLDEEIARAILIGDGRLASSDEKINESNVRPIWKDEDLYAIKASVDVTAAMTGDQKAKAFIRAAIKARKTYQGSGDCKLFCPEDVLTDCLLMEDNQGRVIYDSVTKLATVLRVGEIVPVPVMENQTRTSGADTLTLLGIIVDLNDYNVGADKGGAVNMFDDFDIDYNAQKYLIETRCSGALTKPYSAIVLEQKIVSGT